MSNLDDFFKKRDKKKKTARAKFSTLDPDEFAKQLEASTTKNEFEDPEYQADSAVATEFVSNTTSVTGVIGSSTNNNSNSNEHIDEEWKPFDSDENKDYSGLRINIQNWKAEDEENNNERLVDENEKKPSCPWGAAQIKLFNNAQNEDQETTDNTESNVDDNNQNQSDDASINTNSSAKPTETTASTAASAYVPPHLRKKAEAEPAKPSTTTESSSKYVPPSLRNKNINSFESAIPTTSVNYRRPNKSQPNINDTLEFPTLDATVADNPSSDKTTSENDEKFDFPKKSGRIEAKTNNNMIDLENKFTALSSSNN